MRALIVADATGLKMPTLGIQLLATRKRPHADRIEGITI
jgi:hypothetical protein